MPLCFGCIATHTSTGCIIAGHALLLPKDGDAGKGDRRARKPCRRDHADAERPAGHHPPNVLEDVAKEGAFSFAFLRFERKSKRLCE